MKEHPENENVIVYPENITRLLHFETIRERVRSYCYTPLGAALSDQQPWLTEASSIEKELRKVIQFKHIFRFSIPFPAITCHDLTDVFKHIHIENSYFDIEVFLQIKDNVNSIGFILQFFKEREDAQAFYALEQMVRAAFYDSKIVVLIDKVIDEKGVVRDNASKELSAIRALIHSKNRQIERAYQTAHKELQAKGYLTDTEETIRNGRRVFAVYAEHKRTIHGIIHDESETGKTTYIEPEQVIFLNNELSELQRDESREIRKILIQLTASMRQYSDLILSYQSILAEFDYVRAKGKLAYEMNGNLPMFSTQEKKLLNAFHPVLKLLHLGTSKPTVPFQMLLNKTERMLLISGPNAGGKSVTMNAVGLMCMMLQKGMAVPCEDRSTFILFDQIFADVGDAQSIQDELSTYSSKLKHMLYFLQHANERTLILIDEMGSGTDPMFGGAVAESVLEALAQTKAYAIITTHFGNLKTLGEKHPAISNGCMLFDEKEHAPTYIFSQGKPGSSYTFEIAKKSGLPEELLQHALSKLDQDKVKYDDLLHSLEQQEWQWQKKNKALETQQQELQAQIKKWQRLNQELEINRKRIQFERIQDKHNLTLEKKKQLNEFLEDIKRTDKSLLKLEQKVLEESVQQEQEQIKTIYKQIHKGVADKPIREGDKVRYLATDSIGVVEKISGKKAIVVFGNIKSTLPLEDLIPDERKVETLGNNRRVVDLADKSQITNELDLRGKFKQEAIQLLEAYIDKALVNNVWQFKIIHGTGTLKNAVTECLRTYPQLSKYYHPERESGGEGATVVLV